MNDLSYLLDMGLRDGELVHLHRASGPYNPADPSTWSAAQLNGYIDVPDELTPAQKLRSKFLTRAQIGKLEPLQPLVDGFLYAETLARLVGEPGSYKSFLALDWACRIQTGTDWHGHAVTQGNVVYLVGEGVRGIDARLTAWELHYNGGDPAGVTFFPEILNMATGGEELLDFGRALLDLAPTLVIIDTQARYTPGAEENSAKDMGLLIHNLDTLQRFTGATILLVHHTARGSEHGRGSTAVEGAMQTELFMGKKKNAVELSTIKQKDSDELSKSLVPLAVDGTASMVLELPGAGIDPFRVVMPRVHSGSPIYERLAAVLYRTFNHGESGGTKAEIKTAMQGDDLRIDGDKRNVGRRFSHAWSQLESAGAIEQVGGLQRFKLAEHYAQALDLQEQA